jgi:hypothetical protein
MSVLRLPSKRRVFVAAPTGIKQPLAKATSCEDTEPSFRPEARRAAEIADFSVFSDAHGEFSVFSQAVQSSTTACKGDYAARQRFVKLVGD